MTTATLELVAQHRTVRGKQVAVRRREGVLPVVIYGKGVEAKTAEVETVEFMRLYRHAGTSTLVSLRLDKEPAFKILIKEVQLDPVTEAPLHADLYRVRMDEKIKANIPLEFVGIAPAVTELEGNLITNKDALEVECLPDALVPHFEVDVSILKTFDDIIHVKDVKAPPGIEMLDDPEEIVVQVTPPRSEEELEAELAPSAAEEEAAAVEKLGAEAPAEKAEGEEGEAEGETPAAAEPASPAGKVTTGQAGENKE